MFSALFKGRDIDTIFTGEPLVVRIDILVIQVQCPTLLAGFVGSIIYADLYGSIKIYADLCGSMWDQD